MGINQIPFQITNTLIINNNITYIPGRFNYSVALCAPTFVLQISDILREIFDAVSQAHALSLLSKILAIAGIPFWAYFRSWNKRLRLKEGGACTLVSEAGYKSSVVSLWFALACLSAGRLGPISRRIMRHSSGDRKRPKRKPAICRTNVSRWHDSPFRISISSPWSLDIVLTSDRGQPCKLGFR